MDQVKFIGQTSVGTHKHEVNVTTLKVNVTAVSQSRWQHSLSRGSATTHLVGLQVKILPGVWMFVSCECCVLSGRGLCIRLITPQESHWVCVCVCTHAHVHRISSNPFNPTQLHLSSKVWINYTHAVYITNLLFKNFWKTYIHKVE